MALSLSTAYGITRMIDIRVPKERTVWWFLKHPTIWSLKITVVNLLNTGTVLFTFDTDLKRTIYNITHLIDKKLNMKFVNILNYYFDSYSESVLFFRMYSCIS